MKKYSDKHLESVPVELILGVEKFLSSNDICPNSIARKFYCVSKYPFCDDVCPKIFLYKSIYPCPCIEFGKGEAHKIMRNLISQWRKWAGLKDGE